jgi:hypothetical protein
VLLVSGSEFAGSFFVSNPSSAFSSRIKSECSLFLCGCRNLFLQVLHKIHSHFDQGLYAPTVYSELVQELALPC